MNMSMICLAARGLSAGTICPAPRTITSMKLPLAFTKLKRLNFNIINFIMPNK